MPCPCGSGAKFKRCPCGAYEATQFPRAKVRDEEHRALERHHTETYARIGRREARAAMLVLLAGSALAGR